MMMAYLPTRVAAIGATVLATVLIGAGPAFADPPPPTPSPLTASTPPESSPAERAAATIRPAIVYINTHVRAWVVDQNGVALNGGKPIEGDGSCTGFGVSPDGYVATAGHCVDAVGLNPGNAMRLDIIKAAAATAPPGKAVSGAVKLPSDIGLWNAVDPALAGPIANWSVEGTAKGSPPDVTFSVISEATPIDEPVSVGLPPPPAVPGQTSGSNPDRGLPARLVDYRPFEQGDVALLKIEATDLPSAMLAPASGIQVGVSVESVGYPGSADRSTDASLEPSVKDGQISSKRSKGSVPFYEESAPLSPGMSGGPMIGLDSRVVGVNSWSPVDEPQAFNFIAPATGLSELLARNGVRNELGPDDLSYRSALDAYYSGHYTDAIAGFDRLLQTHPQHAQAVQYKILATKARVSFGDTPLPGTPARSGSALASSSPALWVGLGAAAAAILIGGAAAGVRLVRRKNRPRTADVPAQRSAPPAEFSTRETETPPSNGEARSNGRGGVHALGEDGAAAMVGMGTAPASVMVAETDLAASNPPPNSQTPDVTPE